MNKELLQKHQLQQLQNIKDKFKIATLAGAIAVLIAQTTNSYASDIEIYTKPSSSSSSATVILMLDTSGSMDINETNNNGACDLPSGVTATRQTNKNHPDSSRGYKVNYCEVSGVKNYVYRKVENCTRWGLFGCRETSVTWYSCGVGGAGSVTKSSTTCANRLNYAPSISGYSPENGGWGDSGVYYYNTPGSTPIYDRISRLKNALYDLATTAPYDEKTNPLGIKENVQIGIGTFPYTSGSENNLRGYIRIPAAPWNATQKAKVLAMIRSSDFKGYGGTPTSAAYAEAAAYLLGTTTGGGSYSGIDKALNGAASGSKYNSPLSATTASCSGQGIYFLTDGQPQSPKNTNTDVLMAKALNRDAYNISEGISNNGLYDDGHYKSDWKAIGSFAKSLNDLDLVREASGIENLSRPVVTAVVGFGSGITGNDKTNVEAWGKHANDGGIYGQGGYIPASEPEEIVKSLNDFITGVSGTIPSISTGSSTIPLDALDPETIQPYSYFPQFEPKVSDDAKQQLWFGNLKKFYVVNNGVFADEDGTKKVVVEVDKKSRLQDVKDIWGGDNNDSPVYAKYGFLNKIVLGTSIAGTGETKQVTGRNIVTDYEFNGTADENERIQQNLDLIRLTHEYTTNTKTKTDNPDRIKGLMGLLGYNISDASQNLTIATANLRQVGSILHSLPVLITQQGKMVAEKNESKQVFINSKDRKDYVLFGSTQGLLHVVDAETGVEKFAFLPKEMAEKQYELFKYNAGVWDNGKNALYYGVDGEWTAHTVYVSKDDGTLTVDGVIRNVAGGLEGEKENLTGKQWVYGGLRMGGRSYYALDLTDMSEGDSYKPKVKFHIDPSTGTVRRPQKTKYGKIELVIKHYPAIAKMGQSWSKPKLDYVNWNGKRKLVMFVGGGYDAGGPNGDGLYDADGVRTGYEGYEKYNYRQDVDSDREIGSGVYMFDADNGDLLWYASKTKHSITKEEGDETSYLQPDAHTSHEDLKFSVVSDIKTIDRNNDGIVDHLYFGDLAGQAFRVDLNKPENGKYTFSPRVTRILNLHSNDGMSPRFYLPPVFTAHYSANAYTEGGNIVMATFISGNKSSPLLGVNGSPQKTDSDGLQMDAVYAIYEYDIHPTGQYYPTISEKGKDKILATSADTPNLNQLMPLSTLVSSKDSKTLVGAKIDKVDGWGGWYYSLSKNLDDEDESAGAIKGLTPLIAMEGNLYATLYDASEDGSTETCGAGVKGNSFTQRICLPSGVCQEDANFKYNLGSGIVSLNVGPMTSNQGNRGIIIPDPTRTENIKCEGADCPTAGNRFIPAGGALRFIPHRWYERYSTKG